MSIFDRLFKKESAVAQAIAQQFGVGAARMTPRKYDTLSEEGYIKNVIAFRCVSLIAESCASVPWEVYRDEQPIDHPELDALLKKPNTRDSLEYIIEAMVSYYLLAGNSYCERTTDNRMNPLEIFVLRPDRMRIALRSDGSVSHYEHTVGGTKTRFDVDPITGSSDVYHLRHFHPLNDFYGMAAIEAAAYSVDQHNFAGEHNAALLQNGASPSGFLVHRQKIEREMIDRAEKKVKERYGGTRNAGKTMVLGGDWDVVKMGQTMKELDFNEGKLQLAREICTAFGVPHVLVVPGESTYSNLAESRLFLWEEKIIPLLNHLQGGLFNWLCEPYEGLSIQYNLDEVPAISLKRERRNRTVVDYYTSGIIDRNEARLELGYDETKNNRFSNEFNSEPPEERSFSLEMKNDQQLLKTVSDEIDRPEIAAAINELVKGEVDRLVAEYGQEIVGEIGMRSAFEITEAVIRFSEGTTATMIANVNRTTKRLIREEIEEAFLQRETIGQIQDRIRDVFTGQISDVRVARIAETEVTKLTGFAGQEAIAQAGLEQKEWLSTLDGSTRDTHSALDGQRVATTGKFRSPSGAEATHPGAFGVASEDVNCRCAVAAVFPEKSLSPQQKKDLWHKREKQRDPLDKSFMEVSRKMFTMQLEATIKRIEELTGNAQ